MAWRALSPTPPSPLPQHPESSLGVLLDTERCLPFVTKINDGIGFNKKATHVSNSQARQLPDTPPDSCCSPQVKGECPQPPALRAPFLFLNFGEKERPFSPVRSPWYMLPDSEDSSSFSPLRCCTWHTARAPATELV